MKGTSVQGTIVQGDASIRFWQTTQGGEECISIRINSIFWHMGQIKK
jgi:hypothetical protein